MGETLGHQSGLKYNRLEKMMMFRMDYGCVFPAEWCRKGAYVKFKTVEEAVITLSLKKMQTLTYWNLESDREEIKGDFKVRIPGD